MSFLDDILIIRIFNFLSKNFLSKAFNFIYSEKLQSGNVFAWKYFSYILRNNCINCKTLNLPLYSGLLQYFGDIGIGHASLAKMLKIPFLEQEKNLLEKFKFILNQNSKIVTLYLSFQTFIYYILDFFTLK